MNYIFLTSVGQLVFAVLLKQHVSGMGQQDSRLFLCAHFRGF
jgi:hypothetical protein